MEVFHQQNAFQQSRFVPNLYEDLHVSTDSENEEHTPPPCVSIQKTFACAFKQDTVPRDTDCACAFCKWRYTLSYTDKIHIPTLYAEYSTVLKLTRSSFNVFQSSHDPINNRDLEEIRKKNTDVETGVVETSTTNQNNPYDFSTCNYTFSAEDADVLYNINYDDFVDPDEDSEGYTSDESEDDLNYYHNRYKTVHINKKRRIEQPVATEDTTAFTEDANSTTEGVRRLLAFRKVLYTLAAAPWNSMEYKPNMRILDMMTASHLKFIVGKEAYDAEKSALFSIITDDEDYSKLQNLLVVTNRQNGKTTIQTIFIAALSLMSPTGGDLVCVYSLSLSRAQEITTSAKGYIMWILDEHKDLFKQMLLPLPMVGTNNIKLYTIISVYGSTNLIKACPSTIESCRGDRPHIVFLDEFGFFKGSYFQTFTMPLLQQRDRICSCFTTPPPPTEFCHGFIEKIRVENKNGIFFFTMVNHTLVCDACHEADKSNECVHHLYMVPPWKSIGRYRDMLSLCAEKDRDTFSQEMYGVVKDFTGFLLPKKYILPSIVRRPPFAINLIDAECPVIYIGIDPASHERSYMGIMALTYSASDERTSGKMGVLGLSNVSNRNMDADVLNEIIRNFTRCVLESEWVQQARIYTKPTVIVPIAECNHSDTDANTINNAIKCGVLDYNKNNARRHHAHVYIPYLRHVFRKNITPGVGVWTRDQNKEASVQHMYALLKENRIHFAKKCVTVGVLTVPQPPKLKPMREELALQLGNLRREEKKGKIIGKTGNSEDDLAMAALITSYWSMLLRQSDVIEKFMENLVKVI